jgi:hypothetical protein
MVYVHYEWVIAVFSSFIYLFNEVSRFFDFSDVEVCTHHLLKYDVQPDQVK